jgi:hypothetical protein
MLPKRKPVSYTFKEIKKDMIFERILLPVVEHPPSSPLGKGGI